jgi:hypothetical protein
VYTSAGDWSIIGFPQRWRIPTVGRDSPKEKAYWLFHVNQNGEKKRSFITHHYSGYKSGTKHCEERLICFF